MHAQTQRKLKKWEDVCEYCGEVFDIREEQSTFCGTMHCLDKHCEECEVCANEFE